MTTTATRLGPADHGRRMSLAEFESADLQGGHLYELGRGAVVVSDVPNPRHLVQGRALRRQLTAYDAAYPNRIYDVLAGSECKIPVEELESERHPDLAVYRTPPPREDADVWDDWIPALVVEVVSPGSETRDYEEKRQEYLRFGVQEYWIVDAFRREILVLHRSRGRWAETRLAAQDVYRPTLLPGFELNVAAVFAAVDALGA